MIRAAIVVTKKETVPEIGERGECRNCNFIMVRREDSTRIITKNTVTVIVIKDGQVYGKCKNCGRFSNIGQMIFSKEGS